MNLFCNSFTLLKLILDLCNDAIGSSYYALDYEMFKWHWESPYKYNILHVLRQHTIEWLYKITSTDCLMFLRYRFIKKQGIIYHNEYIQEYLSSALDYMWKYVCMFICPAKMWAHFHRGDTIVQFWGKMKRKK